MRRGVRPADVELAGAAKGFPAGGHRSATTLPADRMGGAQPTGEDEPTPDERLPPRQLRPFPGWRAFALASGLFPRSPFRAQLVVAAYPVRNARGHARQRSRREEGCLTKRSLRRATIEEDQRRRWTEFVAGWNYQRRTTSLGGMGYEGEEIRAAVRAVIGPSASPQAPERAEAPPRLLPARVPHGHCFRPGFRRTPAPWPRT